MQRKIYTREKKRDINGYQSRFLDSDGPLFYMSISIVQYLSKIYEKLGFNFSLEELCHE
jgi:hypothetical protein